MKPDVVCVDISMPHLDAVELFKLFAQNDYRGELIIVSGQDDVVLQIASNAATALGLKTPTVHQKPLNFAQLRDTLAGQARRQAAAG